MFSVLFVFSRRSRYNEAYV